MMCVWGGDNNWEVVKIKSTGNQIIWPNSEINFRKLRLKVQIKNFVLARTKGAQKSQIKIRLQFSFIDVLFTPTSLDVFGTFPNCQDYVT